MKIKEQLKKFMHSNRKPLIMLGLFAIIVITLLSAVRAAPTNISADQCYTYTYDYLNNYNITMNGSQEFCCEYGSVLYNITENITLTCNQTDLNLMVNPGGVLRGQQENCNYTVECDACSADNCSVCSLDKYLIGGQSYELHSGACMVDVECENDFECEQFINETYSYSIEAIAQKEGNTISITILNETKNVSADVSAFTFAFKKDYRCPVSCSYDENINWTFEQCKEYLPLLSNNQWMEAFSNYAIYMADANQQITMLKDSTMYADANVSAIIVELKSCKIDNSYMINKTITLSNEVAELEDENRSLRIGINIFWVFTIFAILSIAFLLYHNWGNMFQGMGGGEE